MRDRSSGGSISRQDPIQPFPRGLTDVGNGRTTPPNTDGEVVDPDAPGHPTDGTNPGQPSRGPDLTITAASIDGRAQTSAPLVVAWTIRNEGNRAAEGQGWRDDVWFSRDDQFNETQDIYLGSWWSGQSLPLAVGAEYTQTRTIVLPEESLGAGHLLFVADRGDRLSERDQRNNVRALAVDVARGGGVEHHSPGIAEDLGPGTPVQITSPQAQAISLGLQALANWANDVSVLGRLGAEIPGLHSAPAGQGRLSIGEMLGVGTAHIGLGQFITTRIASPFASFITGNPTPTSDQVVSFFAGLNGATAAVGGQYGSGNGAQLAFSIGLNALVDAGTAYYDLSGLAANPAISVTGEVELDAKVGVSGGLVFGLDLSAITSDTNGVRPAAEWFEQAFFLRQPSTLTISATAGNADIDGPLQLGFFDAKITGGSVSITAAAQIATLNISDNFLGNVPVGDLTGSSVAEAVQITSVASPITVNLPVTGSIGSYTVQSTGGSALLARSGVDSITTPAGAAYTASNFNEGIERFSNITARDALGMLRGLAEALGTISRGEALNVDLPFTAELNASRVADFGAALEAAAYTKLEPTEGVPGFTGFQSLVESVALSLGASPESLTPTFNLATSELTFRVSFVQAQAGPSAGASFDRDTGALNNLAATGAMNVASQTSGSLILGIDLTALGAGAPVFTGALLLSAINGGRGVRGTSQYTLPDEDGIDVTYEAAGLTKFRIETRDGSGFDVNINGLTTVGDVLAAIQTAVGASVAVTLDEGGYRFRFTDNTTGEGVFRIVPRNSSAAAIDLGIFAVDEDGDGLIEGTPLHGQTLADRVFVRDASVTSAITVGGTTGAVTGRVGLVDLAATAAVINSTTTVNAAIAAGARTTLTQLRTGASDTLALLGNPVATSTGSLVLQNVTVPGGISGLTVGAGAQATFTSTNLASPAAGTLVFNAAAQQLSAFTGLTSDNVFALIDGAVDYIDAALEDARYSTPLPILGRTVLDLMREGGNPDNETFIQTLMDRVAAFRADGFTSLQDLTGKLNTALGSTSSLAFNPTTNVLSLDIDRTYAYAGAGATTPSYNTRFVLNVEPRQLGLPTSPAEEISESDGAGQVTVDDARAVVRLRLGLDLSTASAPVLFAADTTEVVMSVHAEATSLRFTSSIGGAPVEIGRVSGPWGAAAVGTAIVGLSSTDTTSSATFTLGLADGTNGRHLLSALSPSGVPNLALLSPGGVIGYANAELPLYKKVGTSPLPVINSGTNILSFTVANTQPPPPGFPQTTFLVPVSSSYAGVVENPDLGVYIAGSLAQAAIENNLNAIVDGLSDLVDSVDDVVTPLLDVDLPVLGNVSSTIGDYFADIRQAITSLSNLINSQTLSATTIQSRLFDILGPAGLGILVTQESFGSEGGIVLATDASEITVLTGSLDPLNPVDGVQITFAIGGSFDILSGSVDFDIGLPALGLALDATVDVVANYGLWLSFGLSITDGFYLDVTKDKELYLEIVATTPTLEASGELGFLRLNATGVAGAPTRVSASFDIDLTAPNDAERITAANFSELSFDDNLNPALTGGAFVNLDLVLSVPPAIGDPDSFPSIHTNFQLNWVLDWDFDPNSQLGESPTISFNNVQLDIGEFLTNMARPIVEKISTALEPVKPIISILTTPIPVISDFMGRPTNLLDLAQLYNGPNAKLKFIKSVAGVIQFLTTPNLFGNGSSYMMNLGSFTLGGTNDRATDIRVLTNLNSLSPNVRVEVNTEAELANPNPNNPNPAKALFTAYKGLEGGGFSFPIIQNPFEVFKILMGQDASFFEYTTPKLSLGFGFEITVPIIGPLSGVFGAAFDISAQMTFGYDTFGLRQFKKADFDPEQIYLLADGFYIKDTDAAGKDIPEVTLTGTITAGVQLGIDAGIFEVSAGIRGGLRATLNADLSNICDDGDNDPTKIRAYAFQQLGPRIIELSGSFAFFLQAYIEVDSFFGTLWSEDFTVVDVTLLTFNVSFAHNCPPRNLYVQPPADVATQVGDQLTLNTGDYRRFNATQRANGSIEVMTTKNTQVFTGVNRIILNGDNDSEALIVKGDPNVIPTVNVTFNGAGGSDSLRYAGTGSVTASGGAGRDTISTDAGNDTIRGDEDNDSINAGDGNNTIYGDNEFIASGDGYDDTITGGAGRDIVYGGIGNDTINTLGGNDDLHGGDGDDRIDAGEGDNLLRGGLGNDALTARSGRDDIDGEGGDDVIKAGDGGTPGQRQLIRGGQGKDSITSGAGADDIDGGSEDDTINAGNGANIIRGGTGNDVITAGDADDVIEGEAGNDSINAGLGADFIVGGQGKDQINGGDGGDVIFGGDAPAGVTSTAGFLFAAGSFTVPPAAAPANVTSSAGDEEDTIDAGPDSSTDFIFGQSGGDTILGGGGADYIDAGDGDDIVRAGQGSDRVFGGEGNNLLVGDRGNDTITAGSGNNRVFGGLDDQPTAPDSGNDTITTGSGNDIIDSGDGDDIISAGAGINIISAGAGNDQITSGNDNDTIDAGAGNDTVNAGGGTNLVIGGLGQDSITTGSGNDTIYAGLVGTPGDTSSNTVNAGGGTDLIFGDEGNDTINAGADNDQVYAQGGNDTIFGEAGNDLLSGGDGDDTIFGGLGDDDIRGDAGSDVAFGGDQPVGFNRNAFVAGSGLPSAPALFSGGFAGDPGDGNDRLLGGGNTDWLFGGDGVDTLSGDSGNDYLDGGLGNDVIRGGAGSDRAFGGADTDFIYAALSRFGGGSGSDTSDLNGDAGADIIYGDNGQDTINGGNDADTLYGMKGADIMNGSAGADVVYGGSSAAGDPDQAGVTNTVRGGDGNDVVYGDQGNDILEGGNQDDTLYGLEGDDSLFGGAGNDRLEGGPGIDNTHGGVGADTIVLYTLVTGNIAGLNYYGTGKDSAADPVNPDTQAQDIDTDVLLINGTPAGDTIFIGRVPGSPANDQRVRVTFNGFTIDGNWRSAAGTPWIEQFQVDAAGGNNNVQFVQGANSLDVSQIIARSSTSLVSILQGGNQNDVLVGSAGRDLLIGRFGDDYLFGMGGDDRLWGDQTDNTINAQDGNDALYTGTGNDDALSQGGNDLIFAGSRTVESTLISPAVTPLLLQGQLFGIDLVGVNRTTSNGLTAAEQNGFNRMHGGLGNDSLYAGYGVDFMYGGERSANEVDTLFDKLNGRLIDQGVGDQWVEYARSLERVWYYEGTTGDDVFRVDYVTTGAFAGTHAISRRTGVNFEIAFNFSLDASNWTTPAPVAGQSGLDALSTYFQGVVNGEADYDVIVINALQGNDEIQIDPGVRKTMWSNGGPGNDTINHTFLAAGTAPVFTFQSIRRDVLVGGDGNDVLAGSVGEDWIFGGDGTDTLTGGPDRQAPDLLFGNAGNDAFQIIPDQDLTPFPGLRDAIFGGSGIDQAIYRGSHVLNSNGTTDFIGLTDTVAARFVAGSGIDSGYYEVFSRLGPNVATIPQVLATVVNPANGHTYYKLTQANWSQSRAWAQALGGDLVTINDSAENTWVRNNLLSAGQFGWLGLNDVASEAGSDGASSNWVWSSGETFSPRYTNWRALFGEPNNVILGNPDGEDYVVMDYNNGADFRPEYPASGAVQPGGVGGWVDVTAAGSFDGPNFGLVEVPLFSRGISRFSAAGVENLVFDTQDGDDAVYLNPQTITAANWGIARNARVLGASIPNIQIRGGSGNDTLFGSDAADSIFGEAGNDYVNAFAGNDFIDGGADNDFLVGDRVLNASAGTASADLTIPSFAPNAQPTLPTVPPALTNTQADTAASLPGLTRYAIAPWGTTPPALTTVPGSTVAEISDITFSPPAGAPVTDLSNPSGSTLTAEGFNSTNGYAFFDGTQNGYNADQFAVPYGQERWFRFRTEGDGGAPNAGNDSFTAGRAVNYIRLTPDNFNRTVAADRLAFGTITQSNAGVYSASAASLAASATQTGIIIFDLSTLLGDESALQTASFTWRLNATAATTASMHILALEPGTTIEAGWATAPLSPGSGTPASTLAIAGAGSNIDWNTDLTNAVRTALESGRTRIALRVTVSGAATVTNAVAPALSLVSGRPGVVADLYSAGSTPTSAPLVEGKSVIDMRTFEAGTYYMRVYRPIPAPANAAAAGVMTRYFFRPGPGANPTTGSLYYAISESGGQDITWNGARARAQLLGGDLVSINDQAENDFVFNNIVASLRNDQSGNGWHWIGLTNPTVGNYVWNDGTTASYLNFAPQQNWTFWSNTAAGNAAIMYNGAYLTVNNNPQLPADPLSLNGQWAPLPPVGFGAPAIVEIPITIPAGSTTRFEIEITPPKVGAARHASFNDTVIGGSGADVLVGGPGTDTLWANVSGPGVNDNADNWYVGETSERADDLPNDYILPPPLPSELIANQPGDIDPVISINNAAIASALGVAFNSTMLASSLAVVQRLDLSNSGIRTDLAAMGVGNELALLRNFSTLRNLTLGGNTPSNAVFGSAKFNPTNNHYYIALPTQTWANAQAAARALGGDLVTINDATENTWVRDNFAAANQLNSRLWIGLSSPSNLGAATYGWSDGDASTYRNWDTNQPDAGTERFVHMWGPNDGAGRTYGAWNNWETDIQMPAVVEFNSVPANFTLRELDLLPIRALSLANSPRFPLRLPDAGNVLQPTIGTNRILRALDIDYTDSNSLPGGTTVASNNVGPITVAPVLATASSEYLPDRRFASRLIDGSGFNSITGTHTNNPADSMWLTAAGQTNHSITFDLGSVRSVRSMRVWNYNDGGLLNSGIATATLQHSVDGTTYTSVGTINLTIAPGTTNTDFSQLISLEAAGAPTTARYVRLINAVNFNNNPSIQGNHTGLSEVRFVIDSPSPSQASPVVNPRFNPATGNWYSVIGPTTWTDAQNIARSMGGDLVTINDAAENAWINTNLINITTGDGWIGLNDIAVEAGSNGANFVWSNGETATYRNFNAGQPDDAGGNQDAVQMSWSTGRWMDANITDGRFAVVEFKSSFNLADIGQALTNNNLLWLSAAGLNINTFDVSAASKLQVLDLNTNSILKADNTTVIPSLRLLNMQRNATLDANSVNTVLSSLQQRNPAVGVFFDRQTPAPNTPENLRPRIRAFGVAQSDNTTGPAAVNYATGVRLNVEFDQPIFGANTLGLVYNPANGHFYSAITTPQNWNSAQSAALAQGGQLVTINDAAENAFILANFGTLSSSFFIGLNDRLTEGSFVWASGQPVTYTNWIAGEPNNVGNEDAVEFQGTSSGANAGKWNDLSESSFRASIVEFDPETLLGIQLRNAVTGVLIPGVIVSGLSTRTLTVTLPTLPAQGTYNLRLTGSQFADEAGNRLLDFGNLNNSFVYAASAPTGALVTPAPSAFIQNASTVDVTWNTPGGAALDTATITTGDITLSNTDGSPILGVFVTGVSLVSGTTYRYTFSGTLPEGQVRINATAGAVRDIAGNASAAAVLGTITVDRTAPTGTLLSPVDNQPLNGRTVATLGGTPTVRVAWTDTGSGLDTATFGINDITVTGATVTAFNHLGGNVVDYTLSNNPADGNVTVTLNASAVADRAANTIAAAPIGSFTLDRTRPTGTLAAPLADAIISTQPGSVDVTWNDPRLDTTSINAANIAITGVTIDRVLLVSGTTYRYFYNDDGQSLADGLITVSVGSSPVRDTAGNALLAGTLGTFSVDSAGPQPTLIGSTQGYIPAGTVSSFLIDWADAATGVGIDPATINPSDFTVTVNGVAQTISSVTALGGFVYQYNLANPLPAGLVEFRVNTNQVADLAGNFAAAGPIGTWRSVDDVPSPVLVGPVEGRTVNSTSGIINFIDVIFAAASGLPVNEATIEAADFLVNGVAPTSLTVLGNGVFRLNLAAPLTDGFIPVELAGDVRDIFNNAIALGVFGTIVVDQTGPAAALAGATPAASTLDNDPRSIDVRFTDGGLGIDANSVTTESISIVGVDIDRVEDMGNGLFRFHYADDADRLSNGLIQVYSVGGTVRDLAGNFISSTLIGSFTLAAPVAGPTVTNFSINNGLSSRSVISTIDIAFDRATNIDNLIASGVIQNAVTLHRTTGAGSPVQINLTANRYRWNALTNTLTINLTTDAFGPLGQTILTDGRYEFRLDSSMISDDRGDALRTAAPEDRYVTLNRSTGAASNDFFRLLGDVNGSGTVTFLDITTLLANFGNTGTPGLLFADTNGDGFINFLDITTTLANFGSTV